MKQKGSQEKQVDKGWTVICLMRSWGEKPRMENGVLEYYHPKELADMTKI